MVPSVEHLIHGFMASACSKSGATASHDRPDCEKIKNEKNTRDPVGLADEGLVEINVLQFQ